MLKLPTYSQIAIASTQVFLADYLLHPRCYWVRTLYFRHKETTSDAAYTNQFIVGNTQHRYRVVRLWEQDSASLSLNYKIYAKSLTDFNLKALMSKLIT